MTRSRLTAAFLGFVLSVTLCSTTCAQVIVVGAKDFTEQLLVAEMTAQLLKARGFDVHRGTGFTVSGIRELQEKGRGRVRVLARPRTSERAMNARRPGDFPALPFLA